MTASSKLFGSKLAARVILACLLILGAMLRLIDLTDPPLDFHSTRQLRNLLVARGIYYQISPDADPQLRELAISFSNRVGEFEPPIIESIVALTYAWTGGENIAIPRILNTLFWLLAGIALFDLARRLTSDEAALISLAFYLVLPFAVQASRSFQPDPLMTSLFILGLYSLYRWIEEKTWRWTILAALLLGLAALVKIVIAFLVGAIAIVAVISAHGWKRFWKSPQVWVMALLIILPAFSYYILGSGERSTEYFISWTLDLIQLIFSSKFYLQWMTFLGSLFGLPLVYLSLIGVLLMPPRGRALLISLWVGYFLYGLTLPFQMYTHSYYHIQLIPVIALGLAPIAQLIIEQTARQGRFWRYALISLMLIGVAYPAWVSRSILVGEDFRHEPAFWENIAASIPADRDTIALTQDYGYRLMAFGWRKVSLWPLSTTLMKVRGGGIDAQKEFETRTENEDYFLITAFGQYERQPGLQEILINYPIVADGDGYLLFDLR
ncbi:MAG: glycosyltransferase family 39 protein [Anaerolineales bacterium]|uniref:Glycosyltransferase family 39 protein n=1 Tax=Candidatus Desulfolinea nitratireducens TaxID=2841698 RepID=A0A8J6NJY3_9CHLR|nr:glycosyltransferase family 39 protein [Candidatus Desulfolinea nitratireducens]MBL6960152.1 glycosyltransferase family 39 protein [Anaerolineales bacterium]